MKQIVRNMAYHTLRVLWFALSLLPMWFHYLMADVLYVLVAHVLRYRRRVVMKNLRNAFPEMSERERLRTAHGFYRFFCDYIAETIKFTTMRPANIARRMQFRNVHIMNDAMSRGQSVALMLGHYGNWEWITALYDHMTTPGCAFGHIYHPLENKVMDRLFLSVRNRMGSQSIPMKETLRFIVQAEREGKPCAIVYISEQVPQWQNIHHWLTFLHQDTPVFTGVERIAIAHNQAVIYADIERTRRGHYVATLRLITDEPKTMPRHGIVETYFKMLETTIRRDPRYWLWSHNRWKRTHEEFDRRFEVRGGRVVERHEPVAAGQSND